MVKLLRRHYILFFVILFIIFLNAFFFFVGPSNFVEKLGVHNTYLVILLIGIFGGVSSFTGPVFFSSMIAFAAGGANPWLLGLSGGLGLFVSDSIFYFLAHVGKKSVPPDLKIKILRIEKKLERFPNWVAFFITFLLLALTPFPNDILMIALAIGGYGYFRFFPYLLAGNITLSLLVAHLGNSLWWLS